MDATNLDAAPILTPGEDVKGRSTFVAFLTALSFSLHIVEMSFQVAVVGVTGMVGQEMLRILDERRFPVAGLIPIASPKSVGKRILFQGKNYDVQSPKPELFEKVDFALFSAGSSTSRKWSPIAAEKGAVVIDNSSAWRRDPEVPLVVPEVNLETARNRPKGIIANPNCSTIQLVVALKPLHDESRLRRVVISTYQAISGAGGSRRIDVS